MFALYVTETGSIQKFEDRLYVDYLTDEKYKNKWNGNNEGWYYWHKDQIPFDFDLFAFRIDPQDYRLSQDGTIRRTSNNQIEKDISDLRI